jgi:hypothetical protein
MMLYTSGKLDLLFPHQSSYRKLLGVTKMKMFLTHIKLTCLFVASSCVLVILPETLHADTQTKLPVSMTQQQKKPAPIYHWYNHTEWAAETWTGNDAPYQLMRTQINAALAQSPQSGQVLLAKYAADHKAHPASPTALFRWAFTSLKLASQSLVLGEDGLDKVRDAFAQVPSPHTYNYSRLRFLLYERPLADRRLTTLGARLLKHTAHDFPVQYYYIASLSFGSTTDMQTALAELQHLIRQQPSQYSLYALEGSIYMGNWAMDRTANRPRQSDANLCVTAFQAYLDHAPANDPLRKNIENNINLLQTR